MTGSGQETSPEAALTYRSGERIELGDVVFEPVNGWEIMGVVTDIILTPNSPKAYSYGNPEAGVYIAWEDFSSSFLSVDIILGPDYVFFVRRKNEMPKTALTYRSGKRVEPGDIVMRPENGELGVVEKVILPYSADAVWHDAFPSDKMRDELHSDELHNVRSTGGLHVKWDNAETRVLIGTDYVNYVRRTESPVQALFYRVSKETVELGDVVMETVKEGQRSGTVVDILIPKSATAASYGHPEGGLHIKWEDLKNEEFLSANRLGGPGFIYLVRRESDSPETALTYRSGERVERGDIVQRSKNGEEAGLVERVTLPYSTSAARYGLRSRKGEVVIHWDNNEVDYLNGEDAFQLPDYVHFVRRRTKWDERYDGLKKWFGTFKTFALKTLGIQGTTKSR